MHAFRPRHPTRSPCPLARPRGGEVSWRWDSGASGTSPPTEIVRNPQCTLRTRASSSSVSEGSCADNLHRCRGAHRASFFWLLYLWKAGAHSAPLRSWWRKSVVRAKRRAPHPPQAVPLPLMGRLFKVSLRLKTDAHGAPLGGGGGSKKQKNTSYSLVFFILLITVLQFPAWVLFAPP